MWSPPGWLLIIEQFDDRCQRVEYCRNQNLVRGRQTMISILFAAFYFPHTTVKKTKDGTVDKRTKEGKAIAERMAKARAEKNSLKNRIKRLFK